MHSAPVSQGGVRPADFDSGSGLGMQQSSCDYLIRQPCLAFFLQHGADGVEEETGEEEE
jgi:hypothetical protein